LHVDAGRLREQLRRIERRRIDVRPDGLQVVAQPGALLRIAPGHEDARRHEVTLIM